jgi:hypothetical protein
VGEPTSHAHGAPYTMIVVETGKGSRALEAFDLVNQE